MQQDTEKITVQSGLHLPPQQAQPQLSWEARVLQPLKHSTWLPKEPTLLLANLNTERLAGASPKPAAVMTYWEISSALVCIYLVEVCNGVTGPTWRPGP